MPKKQSKNQDSKNITKENVAQIEENSAQNEVIDQNSTIEEPKNKKAAPTVKAAEKTYSRSSIIFVSALSYLIFFLPFLVCRDEPFARFHLNQALLLWIFMGALYLIFGFIPTVNLIALPFILMFHLLGILVGINYAARGKAKPLPIIGRIKLVKWEV